MAGSPNHSGREAPASLTADLDRLVGAPFIKMTGSGNDFVIFDSRHVPIETVTSPDVIAAICNRHNGIGADGIVLIEAQTGSADARIRYFNSDGSAADLCGNATLCATKVSVALGMASEDSMTLLTDAGLVPSRVRNGLPEIDLAPVADLRPDVGIAADVHELRIGFALVGVPHLVVLCQDVAKIDLDHRGTVLRHHPAVGSAGANVNFVSMDSAGGWRYRTFERGVEGETLACGTGAVATAVLLAEWGQTVRPVQLKTSSGRLLSVALTRAKNADSLWIPTLSGEGRIVFRGLIGQLAGS